MRIFFSPQRRDDTLTLERVSADSIRINGDVFDFSSVPEGVSIPQEDAPSPWISGDIERISGKINLTITLPHGPNPSQAVAFPEPITVDIDGPIALPQ